MAAQEHPHSLGARIARARQRRQLTQEQVGAQFGISSQAVSQWENDRTRPDPIRLAALAELLRARLDWLSTGRGEAAAPAARGTDDGGRQPPRQVPVIDRVAAGAWREVVDPFPPGGADEWLVSDVSGMSDSAFALEIDGQSMAPVFAPGDKVVIDPEVAPRPGDYVVAKLDSEPEATFKKYRPRGADAEGRPIIELAPLNDDWPVLRIDARNPGRIVGTMLEHRRYRSR